MADSFAVDLVNATRPLVLSIDIGSTGTRGGVFDATGRPVRETRVRVEHSFRTSTMGRSEISPDLIYSGVVSVIDGAMANLPPGAVAGVCLDTFASSLVGVEGDAAVTPCYTYADSRPAVEIPGLRGSISEGRLQQRTGTRLHTSYLPAKLRWIARTQPDIFDLVSHWMSLGEYVYLRLLGVRGVAASTAAWAGMLNRHDAVWESELLAPLNLRAEQLAEVRMPDQPFTEIPAAIAKRWPALKDAVWFPAVPDGYANHFGSGHADSQTLMLSASTTGAIRMLVEGVPDSIPSGLWCYRVDRNHCLVGGALNDVGRAVTWLEGITKLPISGTRNEYLAGPPNASSPIVLPFLTGERSTGWRGDARAIFAEVSAETDTAAIYRGTMEGVAMTYRRVVEQLSLISPELTSVIAAGGITTALPAWLEIVASVIGLPVRPLTIKRSTLRGNAVLALQQLAPEIPRTIPDLGTVVQPDLSWMSEYQERYERFLDLYATNFHR